MKRTPMISLLLVVAMLVLVLTGCGGQQPSAPTPNETPANDAPASSGNNVLLSMGAGSPGGAQQVYVGACASLVAQYANGVELIPETSGSGGSTADLAAMIQGEAEMCYVSCSAAYETYTSPEGSTLRAAWGALPQEFIIVTNDPNIKDIKDLEGKIVAVGPTGSTPESSSHQVFDALGIDATLTAMQWADCFTSLAEGKVDAVTGACGNPTSALMEAETTFDSYWITLTPEEMDTVIAAYDHFAKVTLKASNYADLAAQLGDDGIYETLGIWMCVYTRSDVDQDAVYQAVKAILDHPDELVASTYEASLNTTTGSFVNAKVPLAEGAARYYQEKGIEIPAGMLID